MIASRRRTPKMYTSLLSFNSPVFAYSGATYLEATVKSWVN
jgi:hypothetical protein